MRQVDLLGWRKPLRQPRTLIPMCKRIDCPKCCKPTFAGCGAHIEQVLGDVPKDQRCKCAETQAAAPPASSSGGGGFLSRLFGK